MDVEEDKAKDSIENALRLMQYQEKSVNRTQMIGIVEIVILKEQVQLI